MRKCTSGKCFVFTFLFLLGACVSHTQKMAWPSLSESAFSHPSTFKPDKTRIKHVWPPANMTQGNANISVWDTGAHEKYILLQWPIDANAISSLYGHRRDPLHGHERFHYGLDLVARKGTLVGAAAKGHVVKAGRQGGHGKRVIVAHLGGYFSAYSHLSKIQVQEGDEVNMGEAIGAVGSTGRSTGPHLHLEIWRGKEFLNPLNVLGRPIKL